MCGIAGIFDLTNSISPGILQNMNNIAKYRGPDDEGYLFVDNNTDYTFAYGADSLSEFANNNRYCNINDVNVDCFLGFGHRRLSIIDLTSAGHQPMLSGSGNCAITYNGEIYNYIELKKELEKSGYIFSSNCDTEVILNAYDKWGEECVKHFNGMWAFCIFDRKNQKLFCSRDRLGAKPFHYYYENNRLVFGSELKQVIQDASIPRIMNEKYLSLSLLYGISDFSDETLINDVHVLRGGYNLSLSFNLNTNEVVDFKIYNYWDLKTSEKHDTKCDDYTNLIGREIERSVMYRLRSDAPLAALLSGGLDSSSLVTIASEQLKEQSRRLNTFTIYYPENKSIDESEYARIINDYCGTNSDYYTPNVTNIEEEFSKIVWHTEGMAYFSLIGSSNLIKHVADCGYKVVINGQGGDETLLGYERYYAYYLKKRLSEEGIRTLFRESKMAVNHSKLTYKELIAYYIYFNSPRMRYMTQEKRKRKYFTKIIFDNVDIDDTKYLFEANSLESLEYNEMRKTQLTHILRWDDRLYMSHSIESRVPLIDYEYMEKVMQVPAKFKIEDGYTKILLRKFMNDRMPKSITWRKNKLGFESPTKDWTSGFSDEYIEEMTGNARSRKYFNLNNIKELFRRNPNAQIIQEFLSIELFMRLFDVKCGG